MPPQSYTRVVFYMLCVGSLYIVTKCDTGTNLPYLCYLMLNFINPYAFPLYQKFVHIDANVLNDDIAYRATKQLGELNYRLNMLYNEEQARQFELTNITDLITSRIPCSCDNGLCKCCAGLLSVIGMNSCAEVAYRPDEFSFELRLRMNDKILFRRKVSGQNPPPLCFHPPRFNFAEACIQFHDIWFAGRNMHVCMNIAADFQGFELFDRNFDCLLFGDQGIKIVKPEDSLPIKPAEVDIDDEDDEIEDYDENVIRRKRS